MSVFPSNSTITSALGLITTGTPYLALYTSNPTAANTGTEVSGGSYARKAITFSAPSGGTVTNTNEIRFTGMPTAVATHFAIHGTLTGGTDFRAYGALSATVSASSGDEVVFNVGAVSVNLTGS